MRIYIDDQIKKEKEHNSYIKKWENMDKVRQIINISKEILDE